MEPKRPAYFPPAELPRGPELQVPSEGSERRMPRVLGEVGVEAGEQGSDGMPRSARMVEPAEREEGGKVGPRHSEAHLGKLEFPSSIRFPGEKWVVQPDHTAQPLGSETD